MGIDYHKARRITFELVSSLPLEFIGTLITNPHEADQQCGHGNEKSKEDSDKVEGLFNLLKISDNDKIYKYLVVTGSTIEDSLEIECDVTIHFPLWRSKN